MVTGREKELQYLNEYYKKTGTQILVVYGQKGIGKTTLLEQFMDGKDYWYYEAISCSTRQQRVFMAEHLKDMGVSSLEYPEFEELFSAIEESKDSKKILVIDEFQNMCKTDTDFFEALYRYINRADKKNDMFVILCSSSIGWVENSMVSKLGSLSRMLSGFYKIKELKYQDFKVHFPLFSKEDSIGAFSILGGVPGLWQFFNDEFTLRENIESFILQSNEKLFDYGQQYVAEELRETAVYNTLLVALASGKRKLNDLHLHTGFSRAKISVYLKNLMQLEIVEKVFSVDTEGRDNTQKGIYQIRHPYVHFYYRYLFPNQTKIMFMETAVFFDRFIAPTFKMFVTECFRQVCREFLEIENAQGRLPDKFVNLGQWVGKKGNIDILFQNEEDEIMTGICNWENDLMLYEEYALLKECQESAKIKAEYIILFSKGSFDNRLREEAKKNPHLALVSLEQM
ncbi:MAG: AAA family ATPase [Lachnospiraceae bacterium]|nr:AAA family ATPase [Lachnospiraceae bacterium]